MKVIYLAFQFWQACALLHLTAITGGFTCIWAIHLSWSALKAGVLLDVFLWAKAAGVGLGVAGLAQLDARSRFQDYKRVKDLLYENGFSTRIVRLFIHSHCQRRVVRAAARELGMMRHLDRYYQDLGYRWYHILPDMLVKRPDIVLTARYWKKTLFAAHYRQKYVSRPFPLFQCSGRISTGPSPARHSGAVPFQSLHQ